MSEKLDMTQEEMEAYFSDVRMSLSVLKKDIKEIYKNGDPRAVRQALLTLLDDDTRMALQAGVPQAEIDRFDKDCKEVFQEYEQEQQQQQKQKVKKK